MVDYAHECIVGGVLAAGEQVTDVSDYESVNEIALAADILISDYSSIIMDFTAKLVYSNKFFFRI